MWTAVAALVTVARMIDLGPSAFTQEFPGGQRSRLHTFRCPHCSSEVLRLKVNGNRQHSCGCREKAKYGRGDRHGKSGTDLWGVWSAMLTRCHVCDVPGYADRGISVCESWKSDFLAFEAWAQSAGYSPGLQLDRRDNDAGYSPENCRFVTLQVNSQNRRSTVLSPELVRQIREMLATGHRGKDVAEALGISKQTVSKVKLRQQWHNVA